MIMIEPNIITSKPMKNIFTPVYGDENSFDTPLSALYPLLRKTNDSIISNAAAIPSPPRENAMPRLTNDAVCADEGVGNDVRSLGRESSASIATTASVAKPKKERMENVLMFLSASSSEDVLAIGSCPTTLSILS
jgi:hypothetical protein